MASQGYRNATRNLESHLYQIVTEPTFGIGQRAFLLQTEEGNLLWECLSYIDEGTVDKLKQLGGVDSIAISHPHYYSSVAEWAKEFGASVYLHSEDKKWVTNPPERVNFWSGKSLDLFGGLQLLHVDGHFQGGTVLFWPSGALSQGVILSGDILSVVYDRRWVSFMYSYPNLIPLPARKVRHIAHSVLRCKFDRIYSSFEGREILEGAKNAVRRSADRYIRHLR